MRGLMTTIFRGGTTLFLFFSLVSASLVFGQTPTHLSDEQIKAAISGPEGGVVQFHDILSINGCKAQSREALVFSPAGLLWVLNASARKQFRPFQPTESETLNALTIFGKGCVGRTADGPVCESITRIVLLSDKHGTIVVEASKSEETPHVWQNEFGATSTCSSIMSKFAMDDVKKVQNANGEFFIAIFDKTAPLKIFEVKGKNLRTLGL